MAYPDFSCLINGWAQHSDKPRPPQSKNKIKKSLELGEWMCRTTGSYVPAKPFCDCKKDVKNNDETIHGQNVFGRD